MSSHIGKDKHLVRLCLYIKTTTDEENGHFLSSSFHLREIKNKIEDYLSCDLSEFHEKGSLDENICISINNILNNYFKSKNSEKDKKRYNDMKYFAILDTTSLLEENKSHKNPIDSIKRTNKSHSGIYFNKNNQQIVAMILSEIANKNKSKFKDIDLTTL